MNTEQKIVFVAHQGEYSDRHVVGVFSTREKAAQYSGAEPFNIEEWIVDNEYEVPGNLQAFYIDMDRDGNTVRSFVGSYYGNLSEPHAYTKWDGTTYAPTGIWQFQLLARSMEHAVKIANEKRAQLIAGGLWL